MSHLQSYHSQGGPFAGGCRPFANSNQSTITTSNQFNNHNNCNGNCIWNYDDFHDCSRKFKEYNYHVNHVMPNAAPSFKRRKFSASSWEDNGRQYQPKGCSNNGFPTCKNNLVHLAPSRPDANSSMSIANKRDRKKFEDQDEVFMSRDEIDRCSPSRKDGIDALVETYLRYSYCAFLQNLGLRLDLPQTTIGTAMVLCHRFFVRRSHASHDRILIATAALFLAAKSEETARPLNNVLRASCEILHKQDLTFISYLLPVDWFEQYRERVIEAEQLILTTLDFELNVQHPYASLTSILDKLGFSQSVLVNLALRLISEGLRSSLWLQFKPHQIAAGAAYLAGRYLNMDMASCQNIWMAFQTPHSIVEAFFRFVLLQAIDQTIRSCECYDCRCGAAVDGAILEI
ncbi:cyclin-T1-4-like isoform X2 [Diospyros lotus]|uniref:cyclin-T1-4-like isoform X2 n=1 Tax=Diospyros lotus TaxID=55363 RepID=UPI00225B32CC|nr:cyclin-T1-4-like isoform X2 [Diospyros lotus]